jgi:hypothetical protein
MMASLKGNVIAKAHRTYLPAAGHDWALSLYDAAGMRARRVPH